MSSSEFSVPLVQAELDPEKLTPAAFYDSWGENVSLNRMEVTRVWHETAREYRELPGHNFGHPKRILWSSMAWADFYELHGLKPDRDVLFFAALLHDAGLFRDHQEQGYSNPEALSADIFEGMATKYGLSKSQINNGKQAILATQEGAVPHSIEDLILVKADLQNVGEDYETSFQTTTELFEAEAKLMASLRGEKFDKVSFVDRSIGRLATYLMNELSLGDFDKEWQARARDNVRRFVAETALSRGVAVSDLLRRLDSKATHKLFEKFGTRD